MKKVEYRVTPVTRYIVTKYETQDDGNRGGCSSSVVGEFPRGSTADSVADAMVTHDKSQGIDAIRSRHGLSLGEVLSGQRVED